MPWTQVRRLGRIFRNFRESSDWARRRSCRRAGREGNSIGISGAVWSGARTHQSLREQERGGAIHAIDARLRGARQGGALRLRDEPFAGKYSRWLAYRRHEVGAPGEKRGHASRKRGAGLSAIFVRAGISSAM